jgi:hypothetical protein
MSILLSPLHSCRTACQSAVAPVISRNRRTSLIICHLVRATVKAVSDAVAEAIRAGRPMLLDVPIERSVGADRR